MSTVSKEQKVLYESMKAKTCDNQPRQRRSNYLLPSLKGRSVDDVKSSELSLNRLICDDSPLVVPQLFNNMFPVVYRNNLKL